MFIILDSIKRVQKMMVLVHKSRYFPIFLISLLAITSFTNSQQPTYNYHLCSDPSNDTAAGSSYRSNLSPLLSSLSSKAISNTFYKDTLNGIYSLFLCRGDVSSSTCQACVDYAGRTIIESCQANRSAIIWYDQCMLRYSDSNFFGSVQTFPNVVLWNVQNNTSPDETDVGALALIFNIADYAPYTDMMYGTNDSVAAGGTQHRYGMGQCSRDLSNNQCRSCLVQLTDGLKECCQGKTGWRILTPSCFLRYEQSIFYNEPLLTPTVPVLNGEGKGGHNKTLIIVVITVSSMIVLAALLGILYCSFHRNRKQRETGKKQDIPLEQNSEESKYNSYQDIQGDNRETHFFKLSTIEAATNSFSDENKLGEGGFGAVYKGMLLDGKEIAVKRLSMKSKQGVEEFKNEVTVIAKLQHKNLVRLLGCCLEGDEKLLVYEYLANNSLDAFLFDPIKCKELDWEKRTNIVNGIARGLLYLHEDSRLKIIHRDLKASNVLLDHEMNPKISDFGTARIFGGKQIEDTTVRVVGTYGYMAPEYALEGAFSIKSDVYSFGILLLEVASGKKNRGSYHPDCAPSLVAYAWKLWNGGKLEDLIDHENLGEECPTAEGLRWIHIALLCVQENPAERPTMSTVVLMLGSSSVSLPMPLQSTPLFSTNRYIFCDETASTTTNTAGTASDLCSTTAST